MQSYGISIHKYKKNGLKLLKSGSNDILNRSELPKNGSINPNPFLDTLAQRAEAQKRNPLETLTKRAIAKYITNSILYPLIDLDSDLNRSYWNTWHCVNHLQQSEEGKITAKYCRNRWCVVCNRIRTAKLINGYVPTISSWEDPQFITLTRPTVSPNGLEERVQDMTRSWKLILRKSREEKHNKLIGIRKTEITYRWRTNHYHPHFHIITNGRSNAEFILNEWLNRHPDASNLAQDIRKADENSTIELFKYFTKLFKRDSNGSVKPFPPESMDKIFQTLYKKRIIQPFGGLKTVQEDFDDLEATVHINENRTVLWDWIQEAGTWINTDTGELRTDSAINFVEK